MGDTAIYFLDHTSNRIKDGSLLFDTDFHITEARSERHISSIKHLRWVLII